MKENKNTIRFDEFDLSELRELATQVVREIEQREESTQRAAMDNIRQAMMAYCQEFGSITFCIDGIETVAEARYMVFGLDTIDIDE